MSAEWSGSLTPTSTADYTFNCSFGGGYGLAWVGGHLLCTHGMPAYAHDVGPSLLPLTAGKAYAVRLQWMKNTTGKLQGAATVALLWGNAAHGGAPLAPIDAALLSPTLPTAAATRMAALQRAQYAQTAGWGSWFPYNLLAVSRLPDGAQLVFGLCQLSTGTCQLQTTDSAGTVRLGAHAADGSYAQMFVRSGGSVWDGGVNISVTWGTQPAAAAGGPAELRLAIETVSCGNCSNWALVLVPSFVSEMWGRVGTTHVDSARRTISMAPAGDLPPTTLSTAGPALPTHGGIGENLAFATVPNAVVAVSSVAGEDSAATVAALSKAGRAERATYASYGSADLVELKEAIQASVMWLVVYTPYASGLMLTLARSSMGGGDSQCDWDNFFASMMLASDARGRDLGFVGFAQELGSKTVDGFVPNGGNAAKKSRDRTEPIVGAKVLLQMHRRFGIAQSGWLIEWAFEQLFGWHAWAWERRRLAPLNMIAPGSDPIPRPDPSDWGVNSMQGARWETGMDNSPMYDGPDGSSDNKTGPVYFSPTDHKMQIWDVGMTANLASDMLALATLGDAWCAAPAATPGVSACTKSGVPAKIATLRQRAGTLTTLTQQHLWDDDAGAFVNLLPAEAYNLSKPTFYNRLSPTSFYPLMTGVPSAAQAQRLASEHLLNRDRFCITPVEDWPPAPRTSAPDAVMLQSWQKGGNVVVCAATGSSAAGDNDAAACAFWEHAGYGLRRNESMAYASAGGVTGTGTGGSSAHRDPSSRQSRVALFMFNVSSSPAAPPVLGRVGDFSASDRVSSTPVCWVARDPPVAGAWPVQLWRSTAAPSPAPLAKGTCADAACADAAPAPRWVLASSGSPARPAAAGATTQAAVLARWAVAGGSPSSSSQISGDRSMAWVLNATLGWAEPLPSACYWGLPSVTFDDPAYATPGGFVYWRGNAWAPLAMLTYWSLAHPAYANVSSVQTARKGLANSYAKMWMETAWRPSHTVCENYCEHERGGCCGDTFYHWGALAGFMSLLEAGK